MMIKLKEGVAIVTAACIALSLSGCKSSVVKETPAIVINVPTETPKIEYGDMPIAVPSEEPQREDYSGSNLLGITTTGVNFRTGYSTDYDIIVTLDGGTAVSLLGRETNGWYHASYNGNTGYICGEYVKVVDLDLLEEQLKDMPSIVPAVQATTDINVRTSPSVGDNRITVVRKGTRLAKAEKLDNGWYRVVYNGEDAYVSGEFVNDTFMVVGEPYKMVYMTQDSTISSTPFGEELYSIPEYELAKVFGETDDFYLVESDAGVGYVKKAQTGTLTGTYVVVDISTQTLTLYRGMEELFSTDVVTGKEDSTPSDIGVFDIDSKQTDAVLKGDDYSCPVKYWMPYNGGEGLHDASWRAVFGGNIYITSGSHGCINMPIDAAERVYKEVSVSDKVLVKK